MLLVHGAGTPAAADILIRSDYTHAARYITSSILQSLYFARVAKRITAPTVEWFR